ncbi:hypothetical protein [Methanopyrus sp. KOL6]|uniref:hypothetical protein n=1 Tax=Methanopyrus sp. KOL6 TaxID=1937004 RepID=UPI000B4B91E4|nr:hypothetical protein [Methanopyrus sp. KOL6]
MRASLVLTMPVIVLDGCNPGYASDQASNLAVPPWFDWVKNDKTDRKYATLNSIEINWAPHYINWVRAAKYVLYVFPKKHPKRSNYDEYKEACREVYDAWAGSNSIKSSIRTGVGDGG